MRAKEFVNEGKVGKVRKAHKRASKGMQKFRDMNVADRLYELNRVAMAAAATDGTFVPKIDLESWSGKYNVAMPYTKEEYNMLQMAYKAIGSDHQDLNNHDLRSRELEEVNKTSPVKPFKGYKK